MRVIATYLAFAAVALSAAGYVAEGAAAGLQLQQAERAAAIQAIRR